MANGYDRFENDNSGGGFVMGLLTGAVLGAGLGMLFAPKAGAELRGQLADQAGNLSNAASEGYRRATATATELAGKAREAGNEFAGKAREVGNEFAGKARDVGNELYGKAKDVVEKGTEEAQRYVREATGAVNTAAAAVAHDTSRSFGNSPSADKPRGTQSGGSHSGGGSHTGGGSRG